MSDLMTIRSSKGDYHVEFIGSASERLSILARNGAQVVVDRRVADLYPGIASAVPDDQCTLFDAVEQNKTMAKAAEMLEVFAARRVRRNQIIVAVGGGIVQDVTAFSASVLYRGVEWTFLPTTLLAQADSCIGGKTSINLGSRKNLVGSFHPPTEVLIDTNFLTSLSDDDIRSGIGEILHYYLYADSPMTERLVRGSSELLRDRSQLRPHIEASLAIKQDVIEVDEFDRGERNKFNYGHTFGHALESATAYRINHGQAVTVGMDLANMLSTHLGFMDGGMFEQLHALLRTNFPTYPWASLDPHAYTEALSADKKNVGAGLTCVLAEGPGKLFKHTLPLDAALRQRIADYFASLP